MTEACYAWLATIYTRSPRKESSDRGYRFTG